MRRLPLFLAVALLGAGLWAPGPVVAQSPPLPFPDVPPWHWAYKSVLMDQRAGLFVGYPTTPAELVANSVAQVYAGFVHAHATGAQAWVERFTYDRPSAWPGPLDRSQLVSFSVRDLRPVVTGDTATATFTVRTTIGTSTTTDRMRVDLRQVGGDWKIDYATLERGSVLFR